jgi:hypothetical protein
MSPRRQVSRSITSFASSKAGHFAATSRKTFHHPAVGRITVDCDVLEVMGTDLRLVIWTAAPGSTDANALALLGVVGLQHFDA